MELAASMQNSTLYKSANKFGANLKCMLHRNKFLLCTNLVQISSVFLHRNKILLCTNTQTNMVQILNVCIIEDM